MAKNRSLACIGRCSCKQVLSFSWVAELQPHELTISFSSLVTSFERVRSFLRNGKGCMHDVWRVARTLAVEMTVDKPCRSNSCLHLSRQASLHMVAEAIVICASDFISMRRLKDGSHILTEGRGEVGSKLLLFLPPLQT